MTAEEVAARRLKVLESARWCFLNFGFSKTSFEDIARRASISRTLLYRIFKDKEEVFTAVFAHWLLARHPEAQRAAGGPGSGEERLLAVCRLMVLEPWSDMATTAMGTEFFDVCERIDPEIEARHRRVALECVTSILGDGERAEVFLLALDGLFSDEPALGVLERRLEVLVRQFVAPAKAVRGRRPRALVRDRK